MVIIISALTTSISDPIVKVYDPGYMYRISYRYNIQNVLYQIDQYKQKANNQMYSYRLYGLDGGMQVKTQNYQIYSNPMISYLSVR